MKTISWKRSRPVKRDTRMNGSNDHQPARQHQREESVGVRPARLDIIDPHHHLWAEAHGAGNGLYPVEQFLDDTRSQHLLGSVFIECGAMYRADGPIEFRPIGETEYAAGAGIAVDASDATARVCAGIVASASLTDLDHLDALLDAHERVADGRLRGVRHTGAWDASPEIPNGRVNPPQGLYRDDLFNRGFARLAERGLSFDAWVYHPQLGDVAELAARNPDTTIIVNHSGGPLGAGPYAVDRAATFADWQRGIRALAQQPNVVIKIGGLGMRVGPLSSTPRFENTDEDTDALAEAIRPYVDTCIDAFGAGRSMFESNFPMDLPSYGYDTIWSAFELLARDYSDAERSLLFAQNANRVYRLGLTASE
ncbi:MAG: amidohydrolase [Glaciihabitans sp.]|nr:amidohydrolase [Glaciihabitans sp.]